VARVEVGASEDDVSLRSDDPSIVLVVPASARLERGGAGEGTVVFAGRYRGAGAKSLSLRGSSFASATLLQDFPDTAPADLAGDREYGRARLRELGARLARSGGDGFLAAAFQITRERFGLAENDVRRPESTTPALPPLALYDVFTGSVAMAESLQLD